VVADDEHGNTIGSRQGTPTLRRHLRRSVELGLPSASPCERACSHRAILDPAGEARRAAFLAVMHNDGMITVGHRSVVGDAWAEQAHLARTAALLRGIPGLVPRGVYRFDSFEEADAWMTRMTIDSLARRSPTTSSASAER
jgi:hypothetical protein